jgi:serine/threonine kinase PknH
VIPQAGPLAAGSRLGGYRLEEPLGLGASAVVFRAVRESDGEVVALKVFRAALTDGTLAGRRLAREVRAAGEVSHPHLVPILEVGEERGHRFVAMRYAGRSLGDRLRADGALPVEEAVEIIAHVAAGLDALHRRNLVHRDVKPQNILIDDAGAAALGDFGVSKGRGYTTLTRPGQIVGTVDYLAPELIKGSEATKATDVYALGCVTYECLTGRPPFAHKSLFRIGVAHLEEQPRRPEEERPGLAPALGQVVLRALAKDPAARPGSAVVYAHMLDVARRASAS